MYYFVMEWRSCKNNLRNRSIVLVVTVVIVGSLIRSWYWRQYGTLSWDEGVHSNAGIMLSRLITGFHSPWEYYYTVTNAYPNAAGSLFFYPWGYDVLTTISFSIFGISGMTARLPSMISSILVPVPIYLLGSQLRNRELGVVAATLAATNPYFIEWGGYALVDLPMTLFLTTAIWLTLRAAQDDTQWVWGALAVSVGFAAQFKPVALYLGPVLWGWLIYRNSSLLRTRRYWASGVAALGIALSYFAFGVAFGIVSGQDWIVNVVLHWLSSAPTHSEPNDPVFPAIAAITNYAKLLPKQVTWSVMLSAGIGFLAVIRTRFSNGWVLLASVFAWTYAFFTLLPNKDWRYTIPFLPVVLIVAAVGIIRLADSSPERWRPVVLTILVLVVSTGTVAGIYGPPNPNPESGVDRAASVVTAADNASVFVHEPTNWVSGNAVAFYMLSNDPHINDQIERDRAKATHIVSSERLNESNLILIGKYGEGPYTFVYQVRSGENSERSYSNMYGNTTEQEFYTRDCCLS